MNLRHASPLRLSLMLTAVVALAGCGGGGYAGLGASVGFDLPGTVVAENDTATVPSTLMHDFRLWPTGYAPSSANLLPYVLFPGDAAAVADVDEDVYDADAFMSDGFFDYLETWDAIHVSGGTDTTFFAY